MKIEMQKKASHNFSIILLELSSKNESKMNQQIAWTDMFHIQPGTFQYHLIKPTITKALSTKRHVCNEENTSSITSCYNELYMKKLNCSFPWLENYVGPLQKCGSDKNINELIEMIMNLDESSIDMKRLGCNIPNCEATKWSVVKSEGLRASSNNIGQVGFKISHSTKVWTFHLNILIINSNINMPIRLMLLKKSWLTLMVTLLQILVVIWVYFLALASLHYMM